MRTFITTLLAIALSLAVLVPTVLYIGMKVSPISWQLFGPVNESGGLALKGYDTVAYFNNNKAAIGDTTKGVKNENLIQYFSSDENKITFQAFPEKFLPQYGGYCATAVASGFTADVNPEIWHIENDKLYLFFNEGAKNDFVTNIKNGIIEQADREWAQR